MRFSIGSFMPSKSAKKTEDTKRNVNDLVVSSTSVFIAIERRAAKVLGSKSVRNVAAANEEFGVILESYLDAVEENILRLTRILEDLGERVPQASASPHAFTELFGAVADIKLGKTEPEYAVVELAQALHVAVMAKISLYNMLRDFCEVAGNDEAADLAQESLDEEKDAEENIQEILPALLAPLHPQENQEEEERLGS